MASDSNSVFSNLANGGDQASNPSDPFAPGGAFGIPTGDSFDFDKYGIPQEGSFDFAKYGIPQEGSFSLGSSGIPTAGGFDFAKYGIPQEGNIPPISGTGGGGFPIT